MSVHSCYYKGVVRKQTTAPNGRDLMNRQNIRQIKIGSVTKWQQEREKKHSLESC